MSGVHVHGVGAVSPAGWGVPAMRAAVKSGTALPCSNLARPGWAKPMSVRTVPAIEPRPVFLTHARLRRSSAITQYAVGAALEALGTTDTTVGATDLAIVLCVMNGCVGYSRRFYDETIRDPATASPLVFPETVFNAPASHLAALLGATGLNYTIVGDPGTFGQGLALAAELLEREAANGCLVVGAEEADWATADACRLFSRQLILGEGAGAIYLRRESRAGSATLSAVTDPRLFFDRTSRARAVENVRAQFATQAAGSEELLCDSTQGVQRLDAPERAAWRDWPGTRLSPKRILGEGLMAAAAWQCVLAADMVGRGIYPAATVNIVGCNHLAIGARFKTGVDASFA